MSEKYNVIYTGELKEGVDREHFIRSFTEQFGASELKALKLINNHKPVLIKSNASKERARKYKKVLENMGMIIKLEPVVVKSVFDTPEDIDPDHEKTVTLTCPKCTSTNIHKGSCLDCGIILERYKENNKTANTYDDPNVVLKSPSESVAISLQSPPSSPPIDETDEMTGPCRVPMSHGATWVSRSFWHVKQNMGAWIGAIIVWLLMTVGLSLIPFVGQFVLLILSPIVTAGFALGCQAQQDGNNFSVGHVFAGFTHNTGRLVAIGLLYLLGTILSIAVIFVFAGSLFLPIFSGAASLNLETIATNGTAMPMILLSLILIGLITPVMMAYWFAPALVVLEDMTAIAAMRSSFMACLKNSLPFTLFSLIFFLLMIVAAIPIFLGYLIVFPMLLASIFVAYRDIYYGSIE